MWCHLVLQYWFTVACYSCASNSRVKKTSQLVLLRLRQLFAWLQQVEEGIRAGDVPAVLKKSIADLLDLTDLVRGKLNAQVARQVLHKPLSGCPAIHLLHYCPQLAKNVLCMMLSQDLLAACQYAEILQHAVHSVAAAAKDEGCCVTALQDRLTLGALITLDVHARDVVQQLVDASVSHTTDFEWASQLRYYWREDVYVEMVQACIAYGYEYLGNTPR